MYNLYQELFEEFKKTNQNCILEIEYASKIKLLLISYIIMIDI